MLEAVLIIVALTIVVLLLGAAVTFWASKYNTGEPMKSVKVASWKGYTVTTSTWFWTQVRNFGLWLKGLFQ